MRNANADLAPNLLGDLLCIAPLRVGILLTLARLRRRTVKLLTLVVRSNTEIASVDMHMESGKPIHLGGELLFSHAVVVLVTTQGPPQKDNHLVRQRHDRGLQRLLFFFPLSCSRCVVSSCDRCYARSVASIRRRSPPCTAACNSSGVVHARYGISSRWPRVSYRIGANLGRFSWAFDRASANCVPRTSKGGYVF